MEETECEELEQDFEIEEKEMDEKEVKERLIQVYAETQLVRNFLTKKQAKELKDWINFICQEKKTSIDDISDFLCKKGREAFILRNRVEIDITNLKVDELKEVSKKHPDGYVKNKEGRIIWVYEKDSKTEEDEVICDNYAERLIEEA